VNRRSIWSSDVVILIYMALGTVVLHVLTGNRYGFQRDELATLDDARHLAWGYVAYPPVTPFFGRLSLLMFGTSLAGFRFFAALAEAVAVVLTGLMARQLGGNRGAQLVLRLLKSDDPRWWIAIGSAIGLGMLSKYTMGVFVAGLTAGVLLTDARRYLANKWLWVGIATAVLIFLPNLIWQAQHGFVSLDFLRHIHERDVRIGRARYFLPEQLELTLFGFPLWLAGLYFYLFSAAGRRFRALVWMYIVPLLLFVMAKGRGYYLSAAYPMLYAAGALLVEQWLASRRRPSIARAFVWTALVADMVVTAAIMLPIEPVNSTWWNLAVKLNEDFREEIGWPELVETVAKIRDSLPPEDRAHLAILGTNYGEAGALNLYGPAYGLPPAISGINSFWQHGYGDPPPETLIVIGLSRQYLESKFAACDLVAHTWNRYGVLNEETRNHPDIFVCRHLRESWPEFWKNFRYFG
jgi:Dolichyl-phosphate-mannose-protein mannosyltransferase